VAYDKSIKDEFHAREKALADYEAGKVKDDHEGMTVYGKDGRAWNYTKEQLAEYSRLRMGETQGNHGIYNERTTTEAAALKQAQRAYNSGKVKEEHDGVVVFGKGDKAWHFTKEQLAAGKTKKSADWQDDGDEDLEDVAAWIEEVLKDEREATEQLAAELAYERNLRLEREFITKAEREYPHLPGTAKDLASS